MTSLNAIMAVILRYFREFGIVIGAYYVKAVEDIPKLSATET